MRGGYKPSTGEEGKTEMNVLALGDIDYWYKCCLQQHKCRHMDKMITE